jgi:D-alanine-D-alanine ligase
MWSSKGCTSGPLQVAVLAGGRRLQRDASLQSANQVRVALEEAGHRTEIFDPADTPLAEIAWSQFDVCFVALHGADADGRVQRRLNLLKVPYTGSGPDACRLAASKSASKERFRQAGLRTPDYMLFDADCAIGEIQSKCEPLPLPWIIQADSQGASTGAGLVKSADELPAAIRDLRQFDEFLLAVRFVPGRRLIVTLIDREPLGIVEVLDSNNGRPEYHTPLCLNDATRTSIEQAALAAAESIATRGLASVSLVLDQRNQPWVLDLDATSNLAKHGVVAQTLPQSGMTMVALCDRLVRDCLPAGSPS